LTIRNKPYVIFQMFCLYLTATLPAIQAVRKQAALPQIIALNTIWDKSDFLDGANAPRPPSVIPIAPKLANPHRAYVVMISDFSWK